MLSDVRLAGFTTVDFFEIGGGYGTVPRFLSKAKHDLLALSTPVYLRNYAVMDMCSVIDLQRWYLNKTVPSLVRQSDWSDPLHACHNLSCWAPRGGTTDLWALDRLDTLTAE